MAVQAQKTNQDNRVHLTLEQERAKHAWNQVTEAKNILRQIPKGYDKYESLAKGLPALIMNSGLMQTLAFLHTKGLDSHGRPKDDEPHTVILRHMLAALHRRFHDVPAEFEGAMEYLMNINSRDFQAITAEAFAWLKWLRQMASARKGGN